MNQNSSSEEFVLSHAQIHHSTFKWIMKNMTCPHINPRYPRYPSSWSHHISQNLMVYHVVHLSLDWCDRKKTPFAVGSLLINVCFFPLLSWFCQCYLQSLDWFDDDFPSILGLPSFHGISRCVLRFFLGFPWVLPCVSANFLRRPWFLHPGGGLGNCTRSASRRCCLGMAQDVDLLFIKNTIDTIDLWFDHILYIYIYHMYNMYIICIMCIILYV